MLYAVVVNEKYFKIEYKKKATIRRGFIFLSVDSYAMVTSLFRYTS